MTEDLDSLTPAQIFLRGERRIKERREEIEAAKKYVQAEVSRLYDAELDLTKENRRLKAENEILRGLLDAMRSEKPKAIDAPSVTRQMGDWR